MTLLRYRDLARDIVSRPPLLGAVRLVCIDGPAGSGKTTLAERLLTAVSGELKGSGECAALLHMDNLYEGWDGLGQVWPRLETWVLQPLSAGNPARYQRYDWHAGSFAEWREFAPPAVLIIEGVGSADLAIDGRSVLKLWVEAPEPLRFERGVARDGEAFRVQWQRWADQEVGHFADNRTRQRADLKVSGSPAVQHDPDVELALL